MPAQSENIEELAHLTNLMELIKKGDGAAVTELKAKASKVENNQAQYLMAVLYLNGNGVTQNRALARKWAKKSATNNNPRAMHMLAYLLENGLGGSKDRKAAGSWYLSSAEAGFAPALQEIKRLKYKKSFAATELQRANALLNKPKFNTSPSLSGPAIPQSAGYTAAFLNVANQPASEDEAVIRLVKNNINQIYTTYIYEMVRRLFKTAPDEAVIWYMTAAIRARYDAYRCTDETARQGISYWPRYVQEVREYLAGKSDKVRKDVMLKAIKRAKEISLDVSPEWICFHGIKGVEATMNGKKLQNWMVPKEQWPTVLDMIVKASTPK
ncbi:tetratricopeptide repeat protein [Kiloniella antarctica]|uniref:Tetratricopeptide repeat protein n=1 Tax=Kiloniella antarctica TaxID=1550907 RepID=A0ABW5BTA2_9PROT